VYVVVVVKHSEAGIGNDGLRKSTECLASISPDSTLAPGSLDRATSQPNLLALGPQDLLSSSKDHRNKSPSRHAAPRSADDGNMAATNAAVFTFPRPAEASRHQRGKSPVRHHAGKSSDLVDQAAKVSKDGVDHERTRNEDVTTEKFAVLDRTLAKVMSGLKTLDAIEQSADVAENVGRTKNSKDDDGEKSPTGVSMTVPIIVKTSSPREDQHGEVTSFASFSRGKRSATLPKSGSIEKMPGPDTDTQMRHVERRSRFISKVKSL